MIGTDLSQFNFGAIMCLMATALYAIYIILSKYLVERVDAMSLGSCPWFSIDLFSLWLGDANHCSSLC